MSELQLYNTLTRQKMPFVPIDPAQVKLYCCGPTVYNYAHIGNLRTYVFEDLLRRILEFNGYVVKHVMNITDVGHLTSDADEGEDKMLKGAKREKKTVWEIAEYYTQAFLADMKALNLLEPHIKCKATDHIEEMKNQVKQLEENGLTYTANGNVYFDTAKLDDYGKLAQLDKQDLQAGARIEVDESKKNPHDFVLWFTKSKFDDQEMKWDSPWGRGYPGWHIECSAMCMRHLGEHADIHCGGIDHIPVHHTNEIAQAEGATGKKPWVNFWMHGNFLVLGKDEKMAKSAGNFLRMQTLIDKFHDPLDYRYFCLQAHYRKELTFSWVALEAARKAHMRLRDKVTSMKREMINKDLQGEKNQKYIDQFLSHINDDLNMPQALALTWDLANDDQLNIGDKYETIMEFDRVLGLDIDQPRNTFTKEITPEIQQLIVQRNEAREAKDWVKSDELRDQIEAAGYLVKDGPGGTEVTKK